MLTPIRRVCAVYLGLSVLLSPVPLLNVLQAESSAVVALVAFFVAGYSALGAFATAEASLVRVLARQEAALIIPLGVLTLAQLWAPNCTYAQGLLFYALFPGVTVVLAVALAYALEGTHWARPGLAFGMIGGLIVLGGPLYDLGLHPQFYTYNHVFGGVLGPIYDEQLAVRPGLFAFRGLTLLWALAAVLVGRWLRGMGPRWGLPICALAIGAVYAGSAPLGINTPAWYLQEQLGGHKRTPHFDLYYDPEQVDEADVAALAKVHEARYEWVRRRLHLRTDAESPRIQSYIYPNPDVKGRLTGARTTSVSPVWLPRPQVHLLRSRVSTSLGHELAHAVSRPYGLPGLRASWAPGLIEGWAVALEPPAPGPSPDDLVLTATLADTSTGLTAEATAIANRLSPWGFWTGRGAVSYATMGSFVQYLLDRYGPEKLKRVYAWANFEDVYGRSLQALATGWAAHLRRTSIVSRGAHEVVTRQFTSPSLFEKKCPHYVPPSRQHLQAARQAARRQDTAQAVANLRRALAAQPQFAAAHEALARFHLAQGRAEAVVHQLDTLDTGVRTLNLRVALADAEVLLGNVETARTLYARARARAPQSAPAVRTRMALREAVASRPAVVRILVSGDSAAVQARRLAKPGGRMRSARQAWRGIRLMEANRYGQALAVWRGVGAPIRSDRPRGWHRAWDLQRMAWTTEAALRAGSTDVASRWGQRAARRAQKVGDRSWAALLDWWARRASTSGTGTISSGRAARPYETGDSR
ncbi:MAG: hypothetical protein ABEL04_05600 [Salinibacter sp.]|uniref:hypothetical protein n=1 Tax=Salinibacter sp. TaxID=2065818 RepID=UPI0035D4B0B0